MISKLEMTEIVLERHQKGQSKWHVYGGVVSYEFFSKVHLIHLIIPQ